MTQSIVLDQSYNAQGKPISTNQQPPVIATRDPTTTDINYKLGRQWINKSTPSMWFLGSKTSGSATWIAAGSGATGGVVTVTGDSGGALSPTAGNINLLGTANQITVTGSGSTETWSLPAAITAPGSLTTTTTLAATTSITAGTTITATLGDITATNGDLNLGTAGNGITIKEGSNARSGTATLVAGTVTVSNTSVTASSRFVLTRKDVNSSTALGLISVGTIVNGTSFVINALKEADATVQTNDVSIIDWMMWEAT